MWRRLRLLLAKIFQPFASAQYFSGIRKFNRGEYETSAEAFSLVSQGVYKVSLLYSRLADFYYQRALRNAALIAFYRNDFIRCIRHCKAALEVAPNDRVCLNYLAHAYHHVGQYGASIKHFRRLVELERNRTDVVFNLAKILIKGDRLTAAIELLDGLIRRFPIYPDFYLIRGIAHAKMGYSELAIDDFRATTSLNPQFANGTLLLGLELVRRTDYPGSYEVFRRGVQSCPDDFDLMFYFRFTGSILRRMKDNSQEAGEDAASDGLLTESLDELIRDISFLDHRAERERNKLLDLDISYGEHFTFLDPVYDKPCLAALVQIFEFLIGSFPQYADYYYKLGAFYIKLGDLINAERVLLLALDINPTYVDALGDLAAVYENTERFAEALSLVTTVLEQRPESAFHLAARGRLLIKLDRLEEAADALRRAREIDDRYTYQLFLFGHILRERGKFAQARACWSEIREWSPEVPRLLRQLDKEERQRA